MKRYDAIIIGAGHNGLTAAAYLSQGWFERRRAGKERLYRGGCGHS